MKQRGVEQEQMVFPLGCHLAAVDIHHIGEQLEGIEGDADGQGDVGNRLCDAENRINRGNGKAGVLEKEQNGKAERHGSDQKKLFDIFICYR